MTWVLMASNSPEASLKEAISVGQTKVKSSGQKNNTTYLPKNTQLGFSNFSLGFNSFIQIVTLELRKGDLLELALPPGHGFPGWGSLADDSFGCVDSLHDLNLYFHFSIIALAFTLFALF